MSRDRCRQQHQNTSRTTRQGMKVTVKKNVLDSRSDPSMSIPRLLAKSPAPASVTLSRRQRHRRRNAFIIITRIIRPRPKPPPGATAWYTAVCTKYKHPARNFQSAHDLDRLYLNSTVNKRSHAQSNLFWSSSTRNLPNPTECLASFARADVSGSDTHQGECSKTS
ncbi:unnamed protein product [Ectocarpus fasciculatus]